MAANATIGKLNVILTGNAKELEGVLGSAEKRIAGFAARAAAPINNIAMGLTRLPSMILSPYTALAAGATAAVSQLVPLGQAAFKNFMPGGEIAAARMGVDEFFGGLEEGAQRGIDRMRHLQRESRRFGTTPGFMAGMERLAGPDAEITGKVFDKMLDFQAKLRSDPNFANSMKPFFKDVEKLKTAGLPELFHEAGDAMEKLPDQTAKLDFLGQVLNPKLADDAFYHFAGGSTAMKAAQGKATAGGAFTPANTVEDQQLREYERDLEQAKKDREYDQRLQKLARDANWQKYQKDSGPLAWARYLDNANNLARVDPTERTNAARNFLRKEGLITGKPAEQVDREALGKAQKQREQQEAAARELQAAEKARDDYYLSFRQGRLNRTYAPWEANLRGQDWFDKLRPNDQQTVLRRGAGVAAEQWSYDHRSPIERAAEQFRWMSSMPLSGLDRGRGIREVMGSLGFDKIRMGGATSLIESGSQAEASLLDSIRERDATESFQNDPAAMKEYLKQIAEGTERQNKANEKLGEQFADLAKAIEETKVNILRMGS